MESTRNVQKKCVKTEETVMTFTNNLILVCTGADTARAVASGLPVLHLCLAVTESGALRRLQLQTTHARGLLGVRDLPMRLDSFDADRLAADLVYEAKRVGALGVFADFERDTADSRRVLGAFDRALAGAELPFYVPLACGHGAHHAILTVETAVSGGSLVEHISSLQGMHGARRIAAFLRPVSNDFVLPSATPDGTALTDEAREALLSKTGSQVFFSRELCAKYFTYSDAENRAHFVLFDDVSTLQAKLAQLSGCGVGTVFALYPDAKDLL